jgi:hypothetical protein
MGSPFAPSPFAFAPPGDKIPAHGGDGPRAESTKHRSRIECRLSRESARSFAAKDDDSTVIYRMILKRL